MRAIIVLSVLTLGFVASACAKTEPTQAEVEPAAEPPPGTVTAELMVEGTDCASCSLGVRHALRGLSGVVGIRQGQSKQHVLVDFWPEQLAAEQIVDAVSKAGFHAEVLVHAERS